MLRCARNDDAGASGAAETYFVLVPSYNTGAKLFETVRELLKLDRPVWVVIDGSTDGTSEMPRVPGLTLIRRAQNGGKGAAVLEGLRAAGAAGFTHVLVMDADGQHPAAMVQEFLALSRQHPEAMILGVPVFGSDAPWPRVLGRRVSNFFAKIETFGAIGDSLFGFRVYPVAPLLAVMDATPRMRGFDFDAEAAVRLCWRGVPAINRLAPVRYPRAEEGGVSHFRYGRDNFLLARMHARLLAEMLIRLPTIFLRRVRSCRR